MKATTAKKIRRRAVNAELHLKLARQRQVLAARQLEQAAYDCAAAMAALEALEALEGDAPKQ